MFPVVQKIAGCRHKPGDVLFLCCKHHDDHCHHQVSYNQARHALLSRCIVYCTYHSSIHQSVAEQLGFCNHWQHKLDLHQHPRDTPACFNIHQQGAQRGSCKDRTSIHHAYHDHPCAPQLVCRQGHHPQHQTLEPVANQCYYEGDRSLEMLCEQGQLDKALDLLFHLNRAPSTAAYVSLLQACNRSKKDVPHAKHIHAHMVHYNVPLTAFLGDYLAMSLAKSGAIEEACRIADNLPRCSVLTWTALIFASIECGQAQDAIRLYQCMREAGVKPNSYTYVSLFKACGCLQDIDLGKKLHAEARTQGLASHVFVGSTLVSMYGKCGAITEAEDVFASLQRHDIVSWNAMLTAYVEQNRGEKALRLFRQMLEESVMINHSTIVFALQGCGILADLEDVLTEAGYSSVLLLQEIGQSLHAEARKKGVASNIMIGSALVSMYGKCGTILETDNAFTSLSQRDAVSWNAMLSSYIEQGHEEKSLQFYRQMQVDALEPDETTFVMVFRACGNIAEKDDHLVKGQSNKVTILRFGQALHADARRLGFASETKVANTLVNMYGKCGAILEAEDVFHGLSHRDIVSWTVLLSMYAEQGHGEKALELYSEMQAHHMTKDEVALLSALQACGSTGSMGMCRDLHYEIVSAGFDHDITMVTTVLVSYRSCALTSDVQACFDGLSQPTIVLWNACMAGHAGEGSHIGTLSMFENMKASNIKPNDLIFISTLSACRHTGLVDPSLEYFESMNRDYDIIPNTKHYGVVLDLLGRAGNLAMVKHVLERAQLQADASIWLSLLGACGTHGNPELAEWAFDHAVKLDPEHAGAYIILSNIYHDDAEPQDFAAEMEFCMQLEGVGNLGWP